MKQDTQCYCYKLYKKFINVINEMATFGGPFH